MNSRKSALFTRHSGNFFCFCTWTGLSWLLLRWILIAPESVVSRWDRRTLKVSDTTGVRKKQGGLERETGIEPATNGLGSRYSTIELLPLRDGQQQNIRTAKREKLFRGAFVETKHTASPVGDE